MLSFLKRASLPVAGALFFALSAAAAHADVVTYYTVGTFGSDTATVGLLHAQSDSVTSGDSTITFNNLDDHTVVTFGNPAVSAATFGDFVVNNTSPITTTTDTFNTNFTLQVFQLVPGSGSGTLAGTISGQVSGTVSAVGTTVQVIFSPSNTLLLPPSDPSEQYVVNNITPGLNGGAPDSITTLNGMVTSVPLPASASTGLALLGGLGVLGGVSMLRRRRQMA
jgi:hypothetical protein